PGDESYSGPFSAEAWVRSNVNRGTHTFVSTRYPVDMGLNVKLNDDLYGRGIRIGIGDGSSWLVTETAPFNWQRGTWYYIVTTVGASKATIYVDGTPIGSFGCSGAPLLYDARHTVKAGAEGVHVGFPELFKGRIDEVAIYQYALSAEQVAAHYAAG